ncbi:MAG: metallophosphoesterase [Gemmatimonadetes bacterium]|nr:MAG: metallophosphoesterase [Gemmatimonadota bacterium]
MKYGIYSDVHGNLEALETVLKVLDEVEKPDELLCLGDVVGYGANPNECANLVRQTSQTVLAGNHDWAALDLTDTTFFNPVAQKAVAWTRTVLTAENDKYLRSLPLVAKFDGFMIVHATPSEPEKWNYIISRNEAKYEFRMFTEQICFIGHTHQPMIVQKTADELNVIVARNGTGVVPIDPHSRYIVNVGSVGQPRDRNPQSAYCIFDTEAMTVQIKRVDYDIETAQEKIINAGLPELLADRLATGD